MTLENQALHLENERLEIENAGLRAERDEAISNLGDAIQSYHSLSNTGSRVFAEINGLAEQAIGHPIEPGHTAVYAVELLVAETAKLRQALEGLLTYAVDEDYLIHQSVNQSALTSARSNALHGLVAIKAARDCTDTPATPGEGGGA